MKIIGIETQVVKVPQHGDPNAGTAGLHGTASRLSSLSESEYQFVPPFRSAFPKKVHTLLVRMLTDDGLVGLGECQAPIAPEVPAALIDRLLAPMLIGQDPLERELLWDRMYASMRERGHTIGFMLDAISALDIALWDLAGKSQQQPVHQLLGMAHRSRVPVYVSGLPGATCEARAQAAHNFASQGFTTIKLFLGHGLAADVAEVEAVRAATGDDVRLLVDVQWLYDVPTAIALGRALEGLGVFWLETPIIPEDTAGLVEICRELAIAVAIGECERTRYQFQPLLAQHAVDIVQPDVGRAGGITETRKIAALAESFGVPCALHLGVGLAAYIAASAHLAICLPNFLYLEYQPAMLRIANTLLVEPLVCEAGFFEIPHGAGLGIQWNEAELAPFVTQRTQLGRLE